jgi:hypothetical protein
MPRRKYQAGVSAISLNAATCGHTRAGGASTSMLDTTSRSAGGGAAVSTAASPGMASTRTTAWRAGPGVWSAMYRPMAAPASATGIASGSAMATQSTPSRA